MDPSILTFVVMSMFTFVAVSFIILETYGFAVHYKVETWPRHPLYHMLTGLFYLQAICVLIIILTWIPFREGVPGVGGPSCSLRCHFMGVTS